MFTDRIQPTLQGVFGFDQLRLGQQAAIEDVLTGAPVLTVMPTGAGKSLCYQLPAVLLGADGYVTLVVSPLIALMKDQVDSLRVHGIEAAQLTSACSSQEQADILQCIRTGAYAIVYVAPERFRSPRFIDALTELGDRLGLLAIDEAHCISEWGHEFRPDYRRLGDVVRTLAPPRLIALTATATPAVREDIVRQLNMVEPRVHVHGFDRPNLHYRVEPSGGITNKIERVTEIVRRRTSGVALVYTATRKNAERIAAALGERGMRARVYHAGLVDDERNRAQDEFMADVLDVIVATNAFGMGVDKSDIHTVIHADLPRSVEAFYQESGRGGRDGERTECVLLFNHGDIRLHEFLINASYPSADVMRSVWRTLREHPVLGGEAEQLAAHLPDAPHVSTVTAAIRILMRQGFLQQASDGIRAIRPSEHIVETFDVHAPERRADIERDKLKSMLDYGYHARCRRQYMLSYFGDVEWTDPQRRCNACDNCKGLGSTRELSEPEKAHCMALLELIRHLDGRFGRTRLAKIANGSDGGWRLGQLEQHSNLRGSSTKYLMDLMRALEGAGLVGGIGVDYPTIALTDAGKAVAGGYAPLERIAIMGAFKAKSAGGTSRHRKTNAQADDDGALNETSPIDADAVQRLRLLRSTLASQAAGPPYLIFSNKTLEALARQKPKSLEELSAIPGIGASKLAKYGAHILAVLTE